MINFIIDNTDRIRPDEVEHLVFFYKYLDKKIVLHLFQEWRENNSSLLDSFIVYSISTFSLCFGEDAYFNVIPSW